ncbi:MAG: HAMP domain-containing protein [Phycisphaerae bacterium]|nr:ATP-binding protein [Phycisphaerae bacterium]NUQ45486.1 HAMP domain-containing protein [Phycisphaerae bacterium]
MNVGRLFWKLFLGHTLLVVAVLAASLWLILDHVQDIYRRDLVEHLKAQAVTIRYFVQDQLDPGNRDRLDALAKAARARDASGTRITLMTADGNVCGDSMADPGRMENHAGRPEVQDALRDGWGESVRRSTTVSRDLIYVALRVGTAEHPTGVVRVAMPALTIGERARTTTRLVWQIGAVLLLAAVLLAMGLAALWSRPIRQITQTARSLSRGDLSARVRMMSGKDELALLARSLNRMRDGLMSHLQTIDRQRRTVESLLAQLHEGVIVAGPDGRIAQINPAAVRLLDLGVAAGDGEATEPFVGRPIEHCIPHPAIREMLRCGPHSGDINGAASAALREARLQVETAAGRVHLLARVDDIQLSESGKDEATPGVGRLLVLTDITELARTIQMKTDFVANASHELRTPLSTIRAAVETLMNLDPSEDPDAVRRFMSVIDRHSARLTELVSDLLDLARVESPTTRFEPEPLRPRDIFDDLESRFGEIARAKGLQFSTDAAACGACSFLVHPHLIRLVLDNLVDNAIKFTDKGGTVRVIARCDYATAAVDVIDTGCGIDPADQERVFERFFQVERARSGPRPGTGLGLSIVRHAVAAMGGRVTLQSEVGRGTHVTITWKQTR